MCQKSISNRVQCVHVCVCVSVYKNDKKNWWTWLIQKRISIPENLCVAPTTFQKETPNQNFTLRHARHKNMYSRVPVRARWSIAFVITLIGCQFVNNFCFLFNVLAGDVAAYMGAILKNLVFSRCHWTITTPKTYYILCRLTSDSSRYSRIEIIIQKWAFSRAPAFRIIVIESCHFGWHDNGAIPKNRAACYSISFH